MSGPRDRKTANRSRRVGIVFVIAVMCACTKAQAQLADYHDQAELDAAILALDGMGGGRMRVFTVGASYQGRPIRAVRLAAQSLSGIDDPGDRPAVLFECGMHAREWASSEMCLWYLQSFALGFLFTPSRVNELLEHATVWVVPMVNPDGRVQDDGSGGDPRFYWTSTFYHPHGSDGSGWRTNVQPFTCVGAPNNQGLGIDLARSFSAGWAGPGFSTGDEADCLDNQYAGEYPFHAAEARHLRRFVNNRMISMSVSVHSNGQSMGTPLGGVTAAVAIRDEMRAVWNANAPTAVELTGTSPGGSGVGQFSAWMAQPSQTAFQPDHSTRRGVIAFMLELPVETYGGAPYQWSSTDGSNAFHPSDGDFFTDTWNGVFESFHYLVAQARSPWCHIDPTTLMPDNTCASDFGFTGAKIATGADATGTMSDLVGTGVAYETLYAGTRSVIWRVQNFDGNSTESAQVNLVVSSRVTGSGSPYTTDLVTAYPYALASGVGATTSASFTFVAGREYMVNLTLIPTGSSSDAVSENNQRLLRFRVP